MCTLLTNALGKVQVKFCTSDLALMQIKHIFLFIAFLLSGLAMLIAVAIMLWATSILTLLGAGSKVGALLTGLAALMCCGGIGSLLFQVRNI